MSAQNLSAWLRILLIAASALPWAFLAAAGDAPIPATSPAGDFAILSEDEMSRTVRHAGGVSVVPARPVRIVALAFMDELAALGIRPVGIPIHARGDLGDYLAEATAGAAPVASAGEGSLPDLDAVARCRPDLILAAPVDRNTWEQLSKIAPTVILRDTGRIQKENSKLPALQRRLRDAGRLTNRTPEAERFISEFQTALGDATTRARGISGNRTIAFLRAFDRDWRLYGRRGDYGGEAILDALDLRGPAGVPDQGLSALDPERLVHFEADYLLVVGDRTPGARQTLRRLGGHPLWRRIPAVRDGRVLELEAYRHWILSGLYGKRRMIDDVLRCLALG